MTHYNEIKLTSAIQGIVFKNRSLAENGPENLLKFPPAREYFNEFGPELFSLLVNSLLDELE